MATCPKCLGPLTDGHRCRRGLLARVKHTIWTVLVGSVAGGIFCYALEDGPPHVVVAAAAAIGAVLAMALRQAVGLRR